MADEFLDIFIYVKKIIKKLLEDIKMFQVNFIIIHIIHKILVLLKITRILKRFWRITTDFRILENKYFFHNTKWFEEYKNIKENMSKNVKSLFRQKKLKKETNDAAIKGIRNLLRLKKEKKSN